MSLPFWKEHWNEREEGSTGGTETKDSADLTYVTRGKLFPEPQSLHLCNGNNLVSLVPGTVLGVNTTTLEHIWNLPLQVG